MRRFEFPRPDLAVPSAPLHWRALGDGWEIVDIAGVRYGAVYGPYRRTTRKGTRDAYRAYKLPHQITWEENLDFAIKHVEEHAIKFYLSIVRFALAL
jgi:predicted phosphoadenosine phosphosulfate sulfurtransferase